MRLFVVIFFLIGAVLTFWWVGLLLIMVLKSAWLPILITIGVALLALLVWLLSKNAKENKGKIKRYSLIAIAVTIFICAIITICKNSYPLITENYDFDNLRKFEKKLISDSYRNKADSILLFANLKFGMTPEMVVDNVTRNNISKTVYFNDYTPSKILIGNSCFDTEIRYYFDNLNTLRGLEIKCLSNGYSFDNAVRSYYGQRYLLNNFSYDSYYVWLFDNVRVMLTDKPTSVLELFDISNISNRSTDIIREKFESLSFNGQIQGNAYKKSLADEERDSIVILSFLGFTLGKSITQGLQNTNNISNIKSEKFEGLSIISFKSRMSVGNKPYPIECNVEAVNGLVGHIEIKLMTNIYNLVKPLYVNKYGDSNGSRWKFRNQQVVLNYNQTTHQREAIGNPHRTELYYTFDDITIIYSDYELEDKILEVKSKKYDFESKQKAIQDRIIKAKEKQRLEKQKDKEANQI